MSNSRTSRNAWLGLAAYVAAYDTWAIATGRETLSTAFHRASRHPVARWPVVAAVGVTVVHLYGRLPKRFDPFHGYSSVVSKLDRRPRTL